MLLSYVKAVGLGGGVMELARNLALQNKKQQPEACVVLIAVGCKGAGLGLESLSNRQNEKLMVAQGGLKLP
jgi:hypothetical protein